MRVAVQMDFDLGLVLWLLVVWSVTTGFAVLIVFVFV